MTEASKEPVNPLVVHVLGALRHSGAEMMLLCAAESFNRAGIDSLLLAMADEQESTLDHLWLRQTCGVQTRHLPSDNWWTFSRGYVRLLRQVRPICVHVHAERASLLTTFLPRLLRIRVIRTVHSSFRFNGLLRARKRIERAVVRRAGVRSISISDSVHDNELSQFKNRSRVILNWYDDRCYRPPTIDERTAARVAREISEDRVVVAMVGNCSPVKNHEAVFRALSTIGESKRPLLLHAGAEGVKQTEQCLCSSLGVASDVAFLGATSDVQSVLFAADAFVMPSLYEGMGIAALEAHATGLPLLLASSPGLVELAGHFSSSRSFAATDIDSIRDLLLDVQLLEANDSRRGERERSSRGTFGLDRGVAEYLAVYGVNDTAARVGR